MQSVTDGQLVMAYIMKPGQLVGFRIGVYITLEVGVIAFLDVVRIQFRSHSQQR